jgi:hypothetical protein
MRGVSGSFCLSSHVELQAALVKVSALFLQTQLARESSPGLWAADYILRTMFQPREAQWLY